MIEEKLIIKLQSIKSMMTSLFHNSTNKYKSSKNNVTVIIKQLDQILNQVNNNTNTIQSTKKQNTFGSKQNSFILNQQPSNSEVRLIRKDTSLNQLKIDHSILATNESSKKRKIRFKTKNQKKNQSKKLKIIFDQKDENSLQSDDNYKIQLNSQTIKQLSVTSSQKISIENNKLEKYEIDSETNQQNSENSIQRYLNRAIKYIQTNQIQQLQDFLYKFKEKFKFLNQRTQVKWSLLMGYCKQMKLEFERAATNYSQVITAISQNSVKLSIEIADIYCRLGRCYYEIQQWNKAIKAYSSSLNIYKKNKQCLQYANCITNLGILYLEIGYFIEAQKCFLMAYHIRRLSQENEQKDTNEKKDKKSHINLLQTYCHLFDCNIKLKNLKQCQSILGNIGNIIGSPSNHINNIYKIRYFTRCGKLLFYEGKLQFAQNYYEHAAQLLKQYDSIMQEHAEVSQLTGLLKEELQDYQSSVCHYRRAHDYLGKCVPIESPKLQVLKKKISCLTDILHKNQQNYTPKIYNSYNDKKQEKKQENKQQKPQFQIIYQDLQQQ